MSAMRVVGRLTVLAAVAVLAGCAVGPNFHRPAAPDVVRYTPEPLPAQTAAADIAGGAAQSFAEGRDIPGQWWTLFHSEALNALIEQSLKANPDLQAAQASLRQAQENLYAQEGSFFPSVTANGSATRQQTPGPPKSIYNLYNASVSASYLLDVFGGTRRAVEASGAAADYARYQLEASYLTLTSNVVTTAVLEGSLRAQIAATQDIIKAQSQELDVLQQQFDLGAVSKAEVLSQQSVLAQSEAVLPSLEKQLAQTHNSLSILLGHFPSENAVAPFELASLQLPDVLPVSLPSKLVEQRPDVRASEALLHEASAEVGVATANMLPQITLSASYSSASAATNNLFSPTNTAWAVAAGLLQPIFRGGTLLHERGAAEAAYDKAAAQYRGTVLAAFADVADALRALQSDAEILKAQLDAEQSAAGRLEITREQFSAGAVAYLSVLDAERTYQQAVIGLVQAQAARYADTAALFQALGGGWWNQPAPTGEAEK